VIAVVASASKFFSFPAIIPTSLFAAGLIAKRSDAGNITAASSIPMPSIIRFAATAKRNGADEIPIIPATTGSHTLHPSSEIGKASVGETASATCRIL
jgi:hypothetical protein